MRRPSKPIEPVRPKEPHPPATYATEELSIDDCHGMESLAEYVEKTMFSMNNLLDVEIDPGYDGDVSIVCVFKTNRPNPYYKQQYQRYEDLRSEYAELMEEYNGAMADFRIRDIQYRQDVELYKGILIQEGIEARREQYNKLKEEFGDED